MSGNTDNTNDGRDDAWDVPAQDYECAGETHEEYHQDISQSEKTITEKAPTNMKQPEQSQTANKSRADYEMICVVGAIVEKDGFVKARQAGLGSEDFSQASMMTVWKIMEELHANGDEITIDFIKAVNQSRIDPAFIAKLERAKDRWPGSLTLYLQAVKTIIVESRKGEIAKHLAILSSKVQQATNLDDLRSRFEDFTKASRKTIAEPSSLITPASVVSSQLRRQIEQPDRYMPTGISKLDFVLGGGLLKRRVVSITGQYKIGKTTLLSTIGYNVAHPQSRGVTPRKVIFITLERNQTDVEMLNASRALGINQRELARHFKKHEKDYEKYRTNPDIDRIEYYHRPGATIEEILLVLKQAKEDHGADLALIDYYQIIRKPKSERRVDHLMDVDQELAKAAEDNDLAIILAAQGNLEGLPKDSQSLLHSAAANFALRRASDQPEAFLENLASNYIEQRDAGSPSDPAMIMNTKSGPHFADI